MAGDAGLMFADTHGGNDTLTGGDGLDSLFGDAAALFDHSTGGNDVLAGGKGDDEL
jgi:hypothetical protein